MKNRLPKTFSREAFERLSHPEKLEYLTHLINALELASPAGTSPVRAAGRHMSSPGSGLDKASD